MTGKIGSRVWMIKVGGEVYEGTLVKYGNHPFSRAKIRTDGGQHHRGFVEDVCFTPDEAIKRAESEIDGLDCAIHFLRQLIERLEEREAA